MVLYMGRDSIDESSKASLNFSTIPQDEDEFGFSRKKAARDPMSHRIIEKRRRDRMNNCLADLSRLIPTAYLKKGRGRIEKTEIIEMAIKHLKHLQAHSCKDPTNCEVAKTAEQDRKRQYRLGYQECMSETLKFLVEIEGMFAGDGMCVRLVNHLQKHYDKITGGMCYTQSLAISEDSRGAIPMDIEMHSLNGDSMCSTAISRTVTSTPSVAATALTTTLAGTIPAYPIPIKTQHDECVDVECPKLESMPHSPALSSHQCTTYSPATSQHPPSSTETTASSHSTSTSVTSSSSTGCTSQLREMLQNPGLPMERLRSNSTSSTNSGSSLTSLRHTLSVSVTVGQTTVSTSSTPLSAAAAAALRRAEEVYKFKNNIKERFNADLRHHTSSPVSVHGEDDEKPMVETSKHGSYQSSTSVPLLVPPTTNTTVTASGTRSSYNGLPNNSTNQSSNTELSVKIPERETRQDSGPSSGSGGAGTWENHLDSSSSSCGSNPSPPSGRSNGSSSSSGYSTGGEAPYTSKVKSQRQSPSSSPYPQVTSDHILTHSPSPQPPLRMTSVPIFALHPNGSFYIPLTLDATLMAPYLAGYDDPMPILHPVNISVNFNISRALKLSERVNGIAWSPRGFVYASERYTNERCGAVYADRVPVPYPCSPVAPN